MTSHPLAVWKKIALAAVFAAVSLAGFMSPAGAQSTDLLALDDAAVCPRDFSMHRDTTLSMICYCGPDAFQGSVWGTGTYTHDSSICNAALHDGTTGPDGGMVLVKGAPGLSSYEGSESNGVRSSDYGSYGWSFFFPNLPKGSGIKSAAAADPCPDNMTEYRDTDTTLVCSCDAEAIVGTVWGTDTYTDDSRVCAAALHAGALGPDGGVVTVHTAAGLDSYAGSERNDVISQDYGSWTGSFYFESAVAAEACPDNMTEYRGTDGTLTCSCAADAMTGTVWGTDIYTDDSSVCAAALHYGAVGPDGGVVTVFAAPGEDSYVGSSYNGVTSQDYGAWSGSFFFR